MIPKHRLWQSQTTANRRRSFLLVAVSVDATSCVRWNIWNLYFTFTLQVGSYLWRISVILCHLFSCHKATACDGGNRDKRKRFQLHFTGIQWTKTLHLLVFQIHSILFTFDTLLIVRLHCHICCTLIVPTAASAAVKTKQHVLTAAPICDSSLWRQSVSMKNTFSFFKQYNYMTWTMSRQLFL